MMQIYTQKHHKSSADTRRKHALTAVLRIMAPIDIVLGNIETAEREANVVTGAVHVVTGVSVRDIQDHGLGDGEFSVVREIGGVLDSSSWF